MPFPRSIFPLGIDHIPLLGSSHPRLVVVVVKEGGGYLLMAGRHQITTATLARGPTAGVLNDEDDREQRDGDDVFFAAAI